VGGKEYFLKPIGVFFSLRRVAVAVGLLFLTVTLLSLAGCSSTPTVTPSRRAEAPQSFWDKFADEITERECNVYRFSCPYGFGPAGEPCECTDPSGFVVKGRTVK